MKYLSLSMMALGALLIFAAPSFASPVCSHPFFQQNDPVRCNGFGFGGAGGRIPGPAVAAVAPGAPTSVPASTLTPAQPTPGTYAGPMSDLPSNYQNAAPGHYSGINLPSGDYGGQHFDGGSVSGIVTPDGNYAFRPD